MSAIGADDVVGAAWNEIKHFPQQLAETAESRDLFLDLLLRTEPVQTALLTRKRFRLLDPWVT